ncbi:MAG: PilZ domain-containing protein [Polyangiales bacterium]
MTQDPRPQAKTAREGLARGLSLLQDPNLPPQFMTAAEPIARAMGMLMQAEKSDGSAAAIRPQAEQALLAVRDALGRLQSIQTSHPAAEQALAAVAGSLSLVHGLTRLEDAPRAPQFQAPPLAAGFQPTAPAFQQPSAPQFQQPSAPQFQPPAAPQFQAPSAPQYQQPPPPQFPPQQPSTQPYQQAQQTYQQAPQPYQPPSQQHAPSQQHSAQAYAPTAMQPPQQQMPSGRPPASPTGGDSIPPPAGTIEAELGAHSPSNFYKTLSGNDIVDHGGIFVATYAVPKLGSRVTLRVHLPGGYHFDCSALVKWTRDARDNPDAPPGFGAQFHGMTPEQRQLVQRYVRNREPLFYDDL